MPNLIQIKRSLNTAIPASLANGELAFTANGDVLYIGSNGSIVAIGGKRNPGVLTANQALIANANSEIDKIIVANAAITSIWANGSSGSNGQVLVSNGTSIYWGTGTSGSDTFVQFNDGGVANGVAGFTFTKSTNTLFVSNTITIGSGSITATNYSGTANNANNLGGTAASDYALKTYADDKAANAYSNAVSYAATVSGNAYSNAMSDTLSRNGSYTGNNTLGGTNTVISSNLTVTSAKIDAAAANLSVNNVTITTDLTVIGNTSLGNNVADTISVLGVITGNLNPSANVTYHLGNNTMRWTQVHTQNVHSTTGYFDGNVEIGGDLIVSGNVTTTNVGSLIVGDAQILLAANNPGDLLDIGFSGTYTDGGATVRHAGFFRDATDQLFKLFDNLTQDLTGNNTIDTANASYRIATLNTYLSSGGLFTNSSVVSITANSTLNVDITANTISLSSPLSGNSGGTGYNSYTAEEILVANTSNGFRKLSLGTDGQVLQSNGSALIYEALDGGSF